MKILVTGVSGGLGRLVVKHLLSEGHEIIATSKNEEKARSLDFYDQVKYIPYDIGSKNDLNLYEHFQRPDSIIHLAWENLDNFKSELHLSVNLENHKRFLCNLIDNGLKDITVVGTCYEYGLTEGGLKETFESKPTIPYPQAKNALREFLEDYQKHKQFKLKWIRVFYVFGEVFGRKNLYTLLTAAIKNGDETFNMSGGQQIRDFLTPDEIADIISKISVQDSVLGIINCSSGKPIKLIDKINLFLKENNASIKLNLGFYPYPDYEPMNTWGDTEKLNKILLKN